MSSFRARQTCASVRSPASFAILRKLGQHWPSAPACDSYASQTRNPGPLNFPSMPLATIALSRSKWVDGICILKSG